MATLRAVAYDRGGRIIAAGRGERAMLMTAAAYRDSLRRLRPRVFVNGEAIESVADAPALAPGIAAIGVTYDFAHRPEHAALMTARQSARVILRKTASRA